MGMQTTKNDAEAHLKREAEVNALRVAFENGKRAHQRGEISESELKDLRATFMREKEAWDEPTRKRGVAAIEALRAARTPGQRLLDDKREASKRIVDLQTEQHQVAQRLSEAQRAVLAAQNNVTNAPIMRDQRLRQVIREGRQMRSDEDPVVLAAAKLAAAKAEVTDLTRAQHDITRELVAARNAERTAMRAGAAHVDFPQRQRIHAALAALFAEGVFDSIRNASHFVDPGTGELESASRAARELGLTVHQLGDKWRIEITQVGQVKVAADPIAWLVTQLGGGS